MDVVRFAHADVIAGELVHDSGQILVDGREDGYAQTEIARPEQCLASFGAEAAYFFTELFEPAGTARHQFYTCLKSLHVVAVGCFGVGELDGHVGRAEGFGPEVLLVVDVDDADDFVSAAEGNLLNLLAHFSITDKCYFHCFCSFV